MKNTPLILLLALILSACSAASPTAIPTIVLDGGNVAPNENQPGTGGSVSASAIIVPVNDAQLSFAAVGRVTAVNVKVGDPVKAGDILVALDTAVLEAKVREAEANVAAADIQVKYLIRVGTDAKHLEVAENEVARAQAMLDSARAVLAAQSNLTAPFDGTIVSVDIAPGETVVPGQVVIILGDLSTYQIETTDLSELNVADVQVGQSAVIFIEALGGEFAAKVTDISLTSSTLGGEVVYAVRLDFDDQPEGLRWGMSADVQFQTGG
jgi:multidrug efflux pump subunit AcrA (membrane-fusion protein)